ncbi:alpha-L-fucosidase [Paenibacillus sp. Soil787]|uniref:alpha-L-fucosidase n=1 Tax=Paenibacillus sp. Soil787 TaxID=1736411 RepID=UPI0006F27F28|nr:alpha-L-fucosidase [Paenibacillus sp. Soil787]KRF43665.1 hypothetical protein ASG93_01720 [Paenibacillus sp. Soil787]
MSGNAIWMKEVKHFGVMVHYLSHTQPRSGEHEQDFNRMIDKFDMETFMEQFNHSGADWLIFTLGQNTGYYCSYNKYLESIAPGCCSRRDLALELAVRVKESGNKFIAYLPTEVDANVEKLREAFGWDLHPSDKSEFMKKYMIFVKEYSDKFGRLADGWWFDGCYNAAEKSFLRTREWDNTRFDRDLWFAAVRSGNSEAAISMCPGANSMNYVFDTEDFLAGEADFGKYPPEELPTGMQPHVLFWLDCSWGHWDAPGEIVPPKVSEDELYEYIVACKMRGAAATINIGIYEDGSMAEKSVEMLHRVSKRLDERKEIFE